MGAKFIVDRRCPVKQSLTLTGLIEAIKQKGLLRRITDLAAAGALPGYSAEARLDVLMPPEVGVRGEMTVRDLQDQTALLLQHRITCRQCPSSLSGHVGGCIAYVPYPLSEGLEYLLWITAVRGLEGGLPASVQTAVESFARRAMGLRQTPYADGMRKRGDMVGARPRVWQQGSLFQKERLTSSQVVDAFFLNGVLAGDDLRQHTLVLEAALAIARGLESVMKDEEQRLALVEDTEPYQTVLDLMQMAAEQGFGIYVWP
ncbi:MAG TPA: hypothetical protein VK464_20595 [Symbiobacteriaceae bacterium]|nr:hypothetical protein [Symbiobacteriaceae bacterium]